MEQAIKLGAAMARSERWAHQTEDRLTDIFLAVRANISVETEEWLRRYLDQRNALIVGLQKRRKNQRRTLQQLQRALILAKYDRGAAQLRARAAEKRAARKVRA